jgi:lysophospholipase L1-like esterase
MLRDIILCLGDSLTYGSRDIPEGRGYPARLAELRTKVTGYRTIIVNKGLTRETTTSLLMRVFDVCRSYPESHLCLLLIGSNDMKSKYISWKIFEENIRHIMWAAQVTGKRVIMGTLPPIDSHMMTCFPVDVIDSIRTANKIIREMPTQTVEFDDMWEYLVDGVHLTPDGYALMAERWCEAI